MRVMLLLLVSLAGASACREQQQASNADTSAQRADQTSIAAPTAVDSDVNPPNAAPSDTASPAAVVRRYYEAINARNYAAAYALLSSGGRSRSQAAFAAGFAETASVRATVSDRVTIEGAAGSQYATVPVDVDAVLRNGVEQHFTGTYTLRRSMVDGATPEQQSWRIYRGNLRAR
jgi:pectin methylesterase-like acyl-CoA thioesterase